MITKPINPSCESSNENLEDTLNLSRISLLMKIAFFTLACASSAFAQHMLWYEQPAKDWNSALPIGNGRIGAMVFGDPNKERIQLNDDSMWAGPGEQMVNAKGTPEDLKKVRALIDAGKYAEADAFLVQAFSRRSIVRSHQTLGDLHLHWRNNDTPVTAYRRQLDLTTGITTATWKRGETAFTQEVFCSNPDEALFIKLTADGPDTINLDVDLTRPKDQGHTTHETTAKDYTLAMSGQVTQRTGKVDEKPIPDMKGVKFEARLRADRNGNTVLAQDGKLSIRDANEVYLRLTASTDFWSEQKREIHHDGTRKGFIPTGADTTVLPSPSTAYDIARKNHIADHSRLYNRSALTLPTDPERENLPTDKRIAILKPGQPDRGLEALAYHYGRYLLIASSRPNGNPANLQGLWNHHIAAPWNCDYHLNINLQMNYWPAEVANLSETHTPVFTWMQELARRGAITAREQYGMRGWMSHHASELRAPTTMKSARAQWGGWIHGGGWMCQHVWTHYDYTRDKKFLSETGYPLLAGQARFYLDWLVEEDGKLISTPESSPENGFIAPSGKFSAVTKKAAMGQQIIHEVFTNTLAAAKALGIENDFTKEIATALPELDKGLHIGPDGRLLEWDKPYAEAEPGHRHLSHLYAFHPGNTITHEKTPKLMEAAKKSIDFRTKHGSVGIGWSRAWAVSIFARLRDGDTAHKHLHEMLRTQTLTNGFNSVFGKNKPVFQIEANFGATAGVAEMLLQSHADTLHLLPALPKEWESGTITGIKARGSHTLTITWENGQLKQATITKGPGQLQKNIMLAGKPIESTDPRLTIK